MTQKINANTNVVGSLFSQREIKFRAWDIVGLKMINDYITVRDDGHFISHNEHETEHIPMQYTGLKDKNSKEIYEGDVVRYTLRHDFSNKELIGEVEWFKYAWRLNSLWLLTEIYMIEVVGNIYEHPELLK